MSPRWRRGVLVGGVPPQFHVADMISPEPNTADSPSEVIPDVQFESAAFRKNSQHNENHHYVEADTERIPKFGCGCSVRFSAQRRRLKIWAPLGCRSRCAVINGRQVRGSGSVAKSLGWRERLCCAAGAGCCRCALFLASAQETLDLLARVVAQFEKLSLDFETAAFTEVALRFYFDEPACGCFDAAHIERSIKARVFFYFGRQCRNKPTCI